MARKPSGNPNGRPRKTIDWEQAKIYAEAQCTLPEISAFFRMDENTLNAIAKREIGETFSSWLKRESSGGKCSLRRSLWRSATHETRPNIVAAIWLSKNYLDMKDNIQADIAVKPFQLAYGLE